MVNRFVKYLLHSITVKFVQTLSHDGSITFHKITNLFIMLLEILSTVFNLKN